MKLRAPRCKEPTFLISVPDSSGAIPPSSAMAVPAEKAANPINSQFLSMSCDPFRHRLHAVELRVPGHQQKEGKVQNRADFGHRRIDARRWSQAADSQGNERKSEYGQHNLV